MSTNLLSDPSLWTDDAGHSPPSYWDGTKYVFNSGPSGGPDQYITCNRVAAVGETASAVMHNLTPVSASSLRPTIVQLLDDHGSPKSPYYQNGTDMESVGSWTITTGALNGGELIQLYCSSQYSVGYAYDFTLTIPPPPIPTYPPTTEVMLSWCDDGGHNFANRQVQDMGETGQTAQRVIFRRIGSTRRNSGLDRVFELSSEAPVQVCLVGASLNES